MVGSVAVSAVRSERCRVIDLGAWLSAKHAIPAKRPSWRLMPGKIRRTSERLRELDLAAPGGPAVMPPASGTTMREADSRRISRASSMASSSASFTASGEAAQRLFQGRSLDIKTQRQHAAGSAAVSAGEQHGARLHPTEPSTLTGVLRRSVPARRSVKSSRGSRLVASVLIPGARVAGPCAVLGVQNGVDSLYQPLQGFDEGPVRLEDV